MSLFANRDAQPPTPEANSAPTKTRAPQSVDISGLPTHLVVFTLWLYARPELAVVRAGPRISGPLDVQTFLENHAASSFVWLDRRWVPFSPPDRGARYAVREYDDKNGRGIAYRAVEGLREFIEQVASHVGSREATYALLNDAQWDMRPKVERFFPPGLALTEELFSGDAPPYWQK